MSLFSRKAEEEKKAVDAEVVADAPSGDVSDNVGGGRSLYTIIEAPVISEKSHDLSSKHGKYVFRVAKAASKHAIKKAVEEIYKVHVEQVNVSTVPRKRRTIKYDRGFQKSYKKATVTLKAGEHITAFDLA